MKKQKNENKKFYEKEELRLIALGVRFASNAIQKKFFPNEEDNFLKQLNFVKYLPDDKKLKIWYSQDKKDFVYSVDDLKS